MMPLAGRTVGPLLAGVLILAGCAQPSGPEGPGAPGWTALPAPPLSPRAGAVTAWTGSEALFLGGDTTPPCLDTADCAVPPAARDGAAFDPAAGTWRRTAEAPRPIPYGPPAVIGDTVYLLADGVLLAYDASDDVWTTHPSPPGAPQYGLLTAVEGTVAMVAAERRAGEPSGDVYDPATRTWSPLPEDPLGPTFDRVLTATSAGLVLTAKTLVPSPGSPDPSLVRAAVLAPASARWTLLEDSEQLGGWRWAWTGRRMVDPSLGGADGGEVNNYGRTIPMGGVLDPASGTWGRLSNAPEAAFPGWAVTALGGPLSATSGWVYDDRDESWTALSPPEGAPPEPGSAVWAGDRLVVLGGIDPAEGRTLDALSDSAWMWTPPSAVPAGTTADDLAGVWALREGTAGGAAIVIPDQARATIEFDGRRVGGTSFCNGYGGTYRLDGADLTLEDIASTLMMCVGEIGEAEGRYLDVLLGGGLQVKADGGRLALTGDRGTLTFYRLPPVPTSDLVGTRWILESIVVGTTSRSPMGEPAVLGLRDDGTATISTGCQTMTGTWTTSGDSVFLSGHVYDPTGCPPEVAEQDSLVTQLLSDGFQVSVDGDVLTVIDVDVRGAEAVSLVYRAAG